ncbi:hypothetical protein [Gemmatimonas phototrophica]|uniref:hypothetical protein n=1 Tax=Gemmatimonas phototrophica TaxID=1379270 RepID=UPI0011AE59B4|nr:hypothetical protein [Gemmatimonas phototrophica]
MAEDTLRFSARVLDANGQVVPGATIRFIAAGGRFEGTVEPSGLVRSGSTGTLPVTVVAQMPNQPTITQRIEGRQGCLGRSRLRSPAGDRRERHREAQERGVL